MTWTNQSRNTTPAPSNQDKTTRTVQWGEFPDGAGWGEEGGKWESPYNIANQPRNDTPTITNQTKN